MLYDTLSSVTDLHVTQIYLYINVFMDLYCESILRPVLQNVIVNISSTQESK
jgi:hypothetical protein